MVGVIKEGICIFLGLGLGFYKREEERKGNKEREREEHCSAPMAVVA